MSFQNGRKRVKEKSMKSLAMMGANAQKRPLAVRQMMANTDAAPFVKPHAALMVHTVVPRGTSVIYLKELAPETQ